MKEFLSNIEPEDYDRIVYPQLVMGHLIAQKTIDDDILFVSNPEKYPPIPDEPEEPTKPVKHPLQGEFILHRTVGIRPQHPRSTGSRRI